MDICKQIEEALVGLSIERVKSLTQTALQDGVAPMEILDRGLVAGLEIIGGKYERQEIFVPELVLAGMAMKEALGLLRPLLERTDIPPIGKVVIGTVEGDVHDVGKNIVSMMLTGAGFRVTDLGIDVSAQKFTDAVREEKPDILALSCLYTPTRLAMKEVIASLQDANLRAQVKVLIGGAPIDQKFCDMIGADGYGADAPAGVRQARSLRAK
ncbi:MAG: corrinoid protein [Thermodesulfobacteriota bacterium]